MQESNLKQFETSFHLRHRQLVFKRPGFLGSVAERGEGFFKTKLSPISAYDSSLHHEHLLPLPVVLLSSDVDYP